MKVILQQDIRGKGKRGQMIEVSDGYARNFLLPKKLAQEANADNINTMRMNDKATQERQAKERAEAVEISKRTGAPVCCTVDLGEGVFGPAGVDFQAGNLGGTMPMPFGSAKIFQAIHGSGVAGCPACGFLFEMGGKTIYHAGDTALTMDMALLEDAHIDVALLPIGDFYTMGPADALRAVKMIKPGLTIPMHYNTFPPIAQDPAAFAAACEAAGFQAKVLQPGETLTV